MRSMKRSSVGHSSLDSWFSVKKKNPDCKFKLKLLNHLVGHNYAVPVEPTVLPEHYQVT